jgi:hypothetical protein
MCLRYVFSRHKYFGHVCSHRFADSVYFLWPHSTVRELHTVEQRGLVSCIAIIVSELYRPNDRRLSEKVGANFLRVEGCRMVSAADPYSRNLGFLDRSR